MPEQSDSQGQGLILERYIREESSKAIARGAIQASWIGFAGGIAVLAYALLDRSASGLYAPTVASFACGVYALIVHAFAKRRALHGIWLYVIILGFVSMPTTLFVVSHFTQPAGAATYITGPFSYVYFFPIAVTGFVFDRRLAMVAGVVAAVEYMGCVMLARPFLANVYAPDPTQLQDLVSPVIFALRATMMLGGGLLVGALSAYATKLISRIVYEEREKQGITRLFGTFVSPEVSERLVREKSATLGECKTVVVLFSDIRAFTTLSEKLTPEALVEQLNEYFDRMVTAITRHGGTVDKFIGDAVMAVFGGVIELDDPNASALDAALEMRNALASLNQIRTSRGQAPIENGIGMHRGEVMQGTIGSAHRKEFTVIGDAVNTASRLEGITKEHGYPIIVSEQFYQALPEARRALCERVGEVHLKGKTQEVAVYGIRS
jgi:class 3 adenylate cyclase